MLSKEKYNIFIKAFLSENEIEMKNRVIPIRDKENIIIDQLRTNLECLQFLKIENKKYESELNAKIDEISNLQETIASARNNQEVEDKVDSLSLELESRKQTIETLQESMSESEKTILDKENEISWLNDIIMKNEIDIKVYLQLYTSYIILTSSNGKELSRLNSRFSSVQFDSHEL